MTTEDRLKELERLWPFMQQKITAYDDLVVKYAILEKSLDNFKEFMRAQDLIIANEKLIREQSLKQLEDKVSILTKELDLLATIS